MSGGAASVRCWPLFGGVLAAGCLVGSPVGDVGTAGSGSTSLAPTEAEATASGESTSGNVDCFIPYSAEVRRICGSLDGLELCYAALAEVELFLEGSVTELRLADLNNDDADDVIVVYGFPYYLQVFWSVPGCGLSEPETLSDEGNVFSADVVDVNDDGLLDIFVKGMTGRLFLNEGAGNFSERSVPSFNEKFAVSVDLDGDSNVDILGFNSWSLNLHLGDGSGGFQLGRQIELAVGASATCAGASDFNEDGYVDLVAGQLRQIDDFAEVAEGVLYFGGPGLTFSEPTKFEVQSDFPTVIATGDFNRDGHADFANSYLVMLGDGKGNFPSSQVVPGMTDNIDQIDFNNDQFIDFRTPKEFLLNRDGVFVGGFDKMGTLGSRAGDLNGDNLVDMAGIIDGEDTDYLLTLFLGVPPG